jgi:hypothetical protein
MKRRLFVAIMAAAFAQQTVNAQPLDCSYNWSERWGSGWCDLKSPIKLAKNTCVSLSIGGSANQILVRVLKNGEDPNQPIGILDTKTVPKNRQVTVEFRKEYLNVVQISVHGGRKAWHIALGNQNGPATLQMVKQINCPDTK